MIFKIFYPLKLRDWIIILMNLKYLNINDNNALINFKIMSWKNK
jgi:hypothetical protein